MLIRVLGSSAGGGFPQWNCNGANSSAVRNRKPGFRPRTQSSLAVCADGRHWVLLNASPDLRQQINETPALWPQPDGGPRNSPIKAAVLTNGDVDHIIGLINLREAQPFSVYGSDRVLATLAANSVFQVLAADKVPRIELPLGQKLALTGDGLDLGVSVQAFAVPGKVALYLEDASKPGFGSQAGDTIGLEVTDNRTGKSFFYIPGCARMDEALATRLDGAALVFFDGTLYTEDEMLKQGLMSKTGSRMGHMNMSGPDGSIAAFAQIKTGRRVFVHINNSNPVLDETSEARKAVEAAGWDVGYDGMEIDL